jgi:hypothetical protein
MLENLLGGLIDKEKATRDTIENSLEDLAEELGVDHKNLFVTIKPINEKFEFLLHLYKIENGRPVLIREVPLKEITG